MFKRYNLIKKEVKRKKSERAGFTLLELLIVIAVLAVLMTMAVITLNPAETLKKARDTQRIVDLSTLTTAIGLYVAETASPSMGTCTGAGASKMYVSVGSDVTSLAAKTPSDACCSGGTNFSQVTAANLGKIDTTGWIAINFSTMSMGSPISKLPIDPTNTSSATPANTDKLYRYVCDSSSYFEINATLESTYYLTTIDLDGTDGGNNSALYEVGTKLTVFTTAAGN